MLNADMITALSKMPSQAVVSVRIGASAHPVLSVHDERAIGYEGITLSTADDDGLGTAAPLTVGKLVSLLSDLPPQTSVGVWVQEIEGRFAVGGISDTDGRVLVIALAHDAADAGGMMPRLDR